MENLKTSFVIDWIYTKCDFINEKFKMHPLHHYMDEKYG